MNEQWLLVGALLTAVLGLILLFIVQPVDNEGFHLQGTIVERRGMVATVATNITLIVREGRRGDTVNVPVFWSGDSFVAVQRTE
jgi:uncharacterized membrane protein YbhN (UPF0104 family)